jgi:hypothetical protein
MVLPRLEAHLRIAGARRRAGADHLRDEMREHFRLKEAGALTEKEYEAAKRKILATHGLAPRVAVRRQLPKKETPPRGGVSVRT